jgi:iron complex outermembrane receptor protein
MPRPFPRAFLFALSLLLLLSARAAWAQAPSSQLRVEIRSASGPVPGAVVTVDGATQTTDASGVTVFTLPPGPVQVLVVKDGFAPASAPADLRPGTMQTLVIDMVPAPRVEEHVTVSATRTERGIEDQPMRVEVVDRDEVDEKAMMTPGDIVMLLNETAGMRVQATSPSLGAARVRIQGMRGRYARFLSDGLPLFGEQVSLGLMQIPPLDLGRVEVIKGVASSLYGAGAMSGVVNLVSKRPGAAPERDVLVNASTRGAADLGLFSATPLPRNWGLTFVGSANGQVRGDPDDDGWADTPEFRRVVGRPRVFWDDGEGRSFFATAGGTWETRTGGTMPGRTIPAGGEYLEGLDTRRADAGASFQALAAHQIVWSVRGSWTAQHQDHRFGAILERDSRQTGFAEVTARRAIARHTLVAGAAIEHDRFNPVDTPQFEYAYTTPGVFVQDDLDVARWLAVSASARVDRHSEFGTFLSPRISALVRRGDWSSRLSLGRGFFAPTPLTEETEAAGLSRLTIPVPLEAERGTNASVDLTRTAGPLSATLTAFYSRITDPVEVERTGQYTLRNLPRPTTNAGLEALAILKTESLSVVANYAYVNTRETTNEGRVEVPMTPRHSVGIDGAWEAGEDWRIGVEWYYTGRQRLEANPYRTTSAPYSVFGVLATRRVGRLLLFVNGENLTNVRQTDWDPLLRPAPGADGRWTVDGWAPLDGRVVNGGVRVQF